MAKEFYRKDSFFEKKIEQRQHVPSDMPGEKCVRKRRTKDISNKTSQKAGPVNNVEQRHERGRKRLLAKRGQVLSVSCSRLVDLERASTQRHEDRNLCHELKFEVLHARDERKDIVTDERETDVGVC